KKPGLASLARKFAHSFCTTSFSSLRTRLLRSFSRHLSFVVRRRLATPLGDAVSVQRMRSQRLRNFRRFTRYGELFKDQRTQRTRYPCRFWAANFLVRSRKQATEAKGQSG
ncbi:MAG: hypothetical protein YPKNTGVA_002127, partial [Candidatus Fervidibacter sp.]